MTPPRRPGGDKRKKSRKERSSSSEDEIDVLTKQVKRVLRTEPIAKKISGKNKKSKFDPQQGLPRDGSEAGLSGIQSRKSKETIPKFKVSKEAKSQIRKQIRELDQMEEKLMKKIKAN